MKHNLKIMPCYIEAVLSGEKTFEIRSNDDRGFQKGDTVVMTETLQDGKLRLDGKAQFVEAKITYVTNYEQKPGFVVFGFRINDHGKQ
ncbi:protein of unknown function DUF3850 [Vibrio phage 1.151.O._10N.222.46.B1]|nr:protein of unknown function DUF3850 [Vibrio phage 1.151.O._10N.222.46.B1]